MSEVKTYNPKAILMSIGGFLLGFFFGNEIFGWIGTALGWMKGNALPTVYGLFGEMGGAIGLVLAGLTILVMVAMVKRWKLLLLIEWIVIGFLCGLLLPWIWPVISGKLAELRLSL